MLFGLSLVFFMLPGGLAQIQPAMEDAKGAIKDFQHHLSKFDGPQMNLSSTLKCTELSLFSELSTQISVVSSQVGESKPHQLAPAVSLFVSLNSALISMLETLVDKADTFEQTSLQSLVATQVSALSFPMYELNSQFLEQIYWDHNNQEFNSVFYAAYSAASAMADAARVYTADVPRFAVESKGPEGHFVFYLPEVPRRHVDHTLQLDKAMPLAQDRCDNLIRLLHTRSREYNSTDVLNELSDLSNTYIGLRDLCKRQMQRNLERSPQYYVDRYNDLASSLSLIISELDTVGRDDYRLSTELTVLSYPVRCFSHIFLKMISEINCKYYPSCLKSSKSLASTFEANSNAVYRMNFETGRCTKLEIEWEHWGRWLCVGLLILVFAVIFAFYLMEHFFKGTTDQVRGLIQILNQKKGPWMETIEAGQSSTPKFISDT